MTVTLFDRITVNPQQCGGRPCIRGMRIRVTDVLDLLASGLTPAQIIEELPDLEPDDVTAALRFASQSADGRPADRGIRQFTAGTGGAELYRFVTTAPNSEVRIAQYGILRLSLQPGAYRWEFVLTAGGLADSGNDICH